MTAETIVAKLVAGWEALDAAAVAACFTEDGVWNNIPYGPVSGRAAVEATVAAFIADMASARFEIRHQGEIAPGVVMNERVDVFETKAGHTIRIPVMGVFEIEDGLVREWRDYFDKGAMAPPA